MAKIDFSSIEGFDAMSADDKLAAIANYEIPGSEELDQLRADNKKQKDLITKYTGEISSLKKTQSAGISEAEKKAREQEEALKDLASKYDELLKSSTAANYKAKYLALGFDEELAAETAQASVDNDFEKVFAAIEKYKANLEKAIKAELVKSTPRPDGKGGATAAKTKEDIMKIKDPSERQKAIAENLNLFIKEN